MEWNWNIEQLQNEFKEQLQRLNEKKQILDGKRPLDGGTVRRLQDQLSVEWTYNSNRIEGNTLTLQETMVVLRDGMTIKGHPLREHFEVINHEKSINKLYQMVGDGRNLNGNELFELHGLVLQNIEDDWAGRFRQSGVRIQGANFIPPNYLKVPEMFEELIAWTNENAEGLHLLLLASVFHHRFVWIHPFADGNGRTVRLAMNLLLMKEGWPPAIILANDRLKYYDALNKANKGDMGKLCLLMLQAMERSLNLYLGALPGGSYDYEPISQVVKEPDVPYGQEYVSLLARQGKIDAYKEGRNWLTTKAAVLNYKKRS